MHMFIDTTTQEWGLSQADIMQRHPLTIFPDPFTPLEQYHQVLDQPQPSFDGAKYKAVEVQPQESEEGYLQQWEVVLLDAAELAQLETERLAAEQAARDTARVTVTKRQALLALFDLKGIKNEDIEAQINLIPDELARYRALVDWQGSAAIESDSPTVLMLAAGLGLTAEGMAQLFDYAQAL